MPTITYVSWNIQNFGFGASMSTLLLIFLLIVSVIYLLLVNRRSSRA